MTSRILFASEINATQRIDLWSYNPGGIDPPLDLGILLPAGASAVSVGSSVLFVGQAPGSGASALYATDGTVAGTHQLILPGTAASGAVTSVVSVQLAGTQAIVCAITANGARSLWTTDGTQAGTAIAVPGVNAGSVYGAGSTTYFGGTPQTAAGQSAGTHGLWRLDGSVSLRLTAAATDVNPTGFATLADGRTLFRSTTTSSGHTVETLWVTDGTVAGTQQLPVSGLAGTSATIALTLDTPVQTTPNAAITLTGSYVGSPQFLDYNFGAGWIQAIAPTFAAGSFSFTVVGGIPAGSYTPQIRDHLATWIVSSAGLFVSSTWSPAALTSSPGAKAVFEFNANNPADIGGSKSAVGRVIDALDPTKSLTAMVATGGNPIVIAHDSGADGKRSLLQFHATALNPNTYDTSTDWLGAGGVGGTGGGALVGLANSTDLKTSGSFTTIIALKIDLSYSYEAGPIWGSLVTSGALQYAQLRYNRNPQFQGANITDSSGVAASAGSVGTVSAGWHVMTMIKDGSSGTLTYRLDGQVVQTSAITSTASFTATDFMIGGGFPQGPAANPGQENGVPAPFVGEFQAYSGILGASDLANAEALAGNSIGLSITPTGATVATAPAVPTSSTAGAPGAASPLLAVNGHFFFTAADQAGRTGLWVSDGTAAGTVELVGGGKLVQAGALAVLGAAVLFSGTDSLGVQGLWRTDGTQAGTSLVSAFGASAPAELTGNGSLVAFAATDAQGVRTLWTSDGSAAGTHELLPAGAATGGLAPTGIRLFYDQLVFTGTDAAGRNGLWMSDGTAAGTHAVAASATDTVLTGSAEVTVGIGRVIHMSPTLVTYAAQDGDTVTGGTGAATVTAGSGSVSMTGGAGSLLFVGGGGFSTVSGGAGAVTTFGGSGGGIFGGGAAGGSVLVAGSGNATLTGGGAGDRLFGSGGHVVMVAAHGRESLIGGSGSTTMTGGATAGAVIFTGGNATVTGGVAGGDTVVGGTGSLTMAIHNDALFAGSGNTVVTGGSTGADSVIGGSGGLSVTGHGDNLIVVGGSGAAAIAIGGGASLVFAGSGTMNLNESTGAGSVVFGHGSTNVAEGSGAMTYDVVKGAAGGTDAIGGYRPGIDRIALFGYGGEKPIVQASGSSSVLSLSDGTHITLLGVLHPGTILGA
jgi:ELWxxDGT repeat protein